jgi:hypothetical protein
MTFAELERELERLQKRLKEAQDKIAALEQERDEKRLYFRSN